MYRIGLGSDIHPFKSGGKLFLGGIQIDHPRGLEGHSDADVVLHALSDALLGAAALGDLGDHFPNNKLNENRLSAEILSEVCHMVWAKSYKIVNVDIVVMAEEPKISPHRDEMREKLCLILNINKFDVSIKATTCDKLGSIGRAEGIFAQAVVLLKKREDV